jgi:PAS domain S-box-containing protein
LVNLLKYIKNIFSFDGNGMKIISDETDKSDLLKKSLINAKGIAYAIDKNYNITWTSNETSQLYPNSVGKKCYEKFAESDIPCPDCYCQKAMEIGRMQTSVKHLNYASPDSGGSFWEGLSIPIYNNNHQISGAISFSQQIENIKKHRDKLLESNLPVIDERELDIFIKDNYDVIFESLHIQICITANNLKIVFNNKSFSELTGKDGQDLADNLITDILPEINDIGTQKILSLIVSGVAEQTYSFILERDFKEKNINLQISPIKITDAKIGGIIWKIILNPKKTIKTDDFIVNSRFNNNFGVMVLDSDGKIVNWNKFLTNTFHWEEDELVGMPNPIISSEAIVEYLEDKSSEKLELTRKTKEGQNRDIKLSVFPVLNNADKISQYVCLIENITYEKYIKSEFKELEERYNNFIKNFEGITFKFNKKFNPILLKGSVRQLLGYTEEELITEKVKFIDLIYSDDKILIEDYIKKIKNHIKTDKELELRVITKDQTVKWIHFYFQNIADEFGNITQIQGFLYNVTQRKEVEEELKLSREKFRNLAMYLETAREEEKKRLALEIHDELGHALTAIKLELAWILKKKFLRHDIMIEKVRKMNELIESTIRKVRTISSDLRPSVLDHFGLEAALEWQASEFQKRSAVRCKIHLDKEAINIDEKTSTAIFRIFQEVLTNIAKHAKASRVDVVLEKNHNNIVLKVRDNGKGFKLEKTKKTQSLGILGMTERANAIGGELSINSVIGVGTTVMLIVPLKKN